jgi:hypothetical protein
MMGLAYRGSPLWPPGLLFFVHQKLSGQAQGPAPTDDRLVYISNESFQKTIINHLEHIL